ncbi:hypothetical protein AAIH70_25330 [Neorhizobium sp. BT27B]|uniref:hypothetical protein n=1 Tax=Neorhizobium sp. BT27B TaxID=3142625 RepID=UPI003D280CC7
MRKNKQRRSVAGEQAGDHGKMIKLQLNALVADAVGAGWSKTDTISAMEQIARSISPRKSDAGDLEEVLAAVNRMRASLPQ